MGPNTTEIDRAVARTLRDSLERLQRTTDELNQAVSDLMSACSSARPSNSLPHMLRAQAAAASLAASLDVLSRFVAPTIKARPAFSGPRALSELGQGWPAAGESSASHARNRLAEDLDIGEGRDEPPGDGTCARGNRGSSPLGRLGDSSVLSRAIEIPVLPEPPDGARESFAPVEPVAATPSRSPIRLKSARRSMWQRCPLTNRNCTAGPIAWPKSRCRTSKCCARATCRPAKRTMTYAPV